MQIVNYPFSESKIASQQAVVIALDCLLLSAHSVNIPKMSAKNATQAITFALEDELLQDLDELSIFTNKDSGGTWNAIVIESKILADIKNEISKQKLNCLALVPEFMLLPVLEGKISYIEKDELVLFRASKFNGGKIDKALFFEIYKPEELQVEVLGAPDANFSLLKAGLWETYGLQVKQFKESAALLAFVLVLNLISFALENQQLSKQIKAKISQNEALFLSTFPDISRITDLPVELEAKLSNISKRRNSLDQGLLLEMSKHKFSGKTRQIKFDNNKLRVSK